MALLEEQNKQLRDTVQKLYDYARAGCSLPSLPASSMRDDRPLLHDIVAYVRALPVDNTSGHEQVSYQTPGLNAAPTVSLSRPQSEISACPGFVAAAPQPDTIMASTMQQELLPREYGPAQTGYDSAESRLYMQEFWTLMEVDPAEAARVNDWLLNQTLE